MLNYLFQYIPKLDEKKYLLRDLLKSQSPWAWDPGRQKCYDNLKEIISADFLLRPDKTSTSGSRLITERPRSCSGLCKPVAFGSKTPTDCQSRYSNIEREMLAIVYGAQQYYIYLYVYIFTVVTEHELLVTIMCKATALSTNPIKTHAGESSVLLLLQLQDNLPPR